MSENKTKNPSDALIKLVGELPVDPSLLPKHATPSQELAIQGAARPIDERPLATLRPDTKQILQQKELNEKRKVLVQQEFQHQYNAAKREQAKLEKVRLELYKLDQECQKNISILRKEIEQEDRGLSACQQHYRYCEREYLKAKQALDKRIHKKQLLTEHLDLIILTNERDKSHKLAQLMDKLGLREDVSPSQFGITTSKLERSPLRTAKIRTSPIPNNQKLNNNDNHVNNNNNNVNSNKNTTNTTNTTNKNSKRLVNSSSSAAQALQAMKAISQSKKDNNNIVKSSMSISSISSIDSPPSSLTSSPISLNNQRKLIPKEQITEKHPRQFNPKHSLQKIKNNKSSNGAFVGFTHDEINALDE